MHCTERTPCFRHYFHTFEIVEALDCSVNVSFVLSVEEDGQKLLEKYDEGG